MIRDLTELSVNIVKAEMMASVQEKAEQLAEERLLDVLLPRRSPEPYSSGSLEEIAPDASRETTKEKLRGQLRAGRLDERLVELETQQHSLPMIEVLSGQGMEEMGIHLKDMLSNFMPAKTKRRRVRVAEARRLPCRRRPRSSSTWTRWSPRRSAEPRTPASCSSTSSTRSPGARAVTGPT